MKRLLFAGSIAGLFSSMFILNVAAETLPPGQVDFGQFAPTGTNSEFVEVNLSSTLISMAARVFEKQEPEIAQLLKGLQLVRVNVIGLDEENRGDMAKRAQRLRKELEKKGWERIVVAQQQDQDVGVYLKTRDKETVQGVAVIVLNGDRQAVFVNIVGDIKPDQLAVVGDKLHIDPLKQLGHSTEK